MGAISKVFFKILPIAFFLKVIAVITIILTLFFYFGSFYELTIAGVKWSGYKIVFEGKVALITWGFIFVLLALASFIITLFYRIKHLLKAKKLPVLIGSILGTVFSLFASIICFSTQNIISDNEVINLMTKQGWAATFCGALLLISSLLGGLSILFNLSKKQ